MTRKAGAGAWTKGLATARMGRRRMKEKASIVVERGVSGGRDNGGRGKDLKEGRVGVVVV